MRQTLCPGGGAGHRASDGDSPLAALFSARPLDVAAAAENLERVARLLKLNSEFEPSAGGTASCIRVHPLFKDVQAPAHTAGLMTPDKIVACMRQVSNRASVSALKDTRS